MPCAPTGRPVATQTAVLLLPVPARVTVAQPESGTPPSIIETLPVGLKPFTVAVKVTDALAGEGFVELDTTILVAALLTNCEKGLLAEAVLSVFPPYDATTA